MCEDKKSANVRAIFYGIDHLALILWKTSVSIFLALFVFLRKDPPTQVYNRRLILYLTEVLHYS